MSYLDINPELAFHREIKKLGKLEMIYGDEFDRRTHTFLKNGARVNVEPLTLPQLLDIRESQIDRSEEKQENSDDTDIDDQEEEKLARIEAELEQAKIDKELAQIFARIFKQFGDQVGMLRHDENGESGMDEWKIGHKFDVDSPVFVIGESRKEELLGLIKNVPAASTGDIAPKFQVTSRFDYLADNMGMQFYYKSVDGKESKKVVFLFGKEN